MDSEGEVGRGSEAWLGEADVVDQAETIFDMPRDALLPTLRGKSVVLRPVTADDAAGLVELLNDEDVRRFTGTHGPVRPGALQRAADYYSSRAADESSMHLAITEQGTGAFIGEAVLSDIDDENLSCSFRIALVGAAVTGRGYGTEATQLIVDHALGALALHRVELEVLAINPRARRVYEKVGFVTEGVKRQAVRWNEEWIDVEIMAVLATRFAGETSGVPSVTRGPVEPSVVVLNGGSSSGKSSIARCLQDRLGPTWLTLGVDDLIRALPGGTDPLDAGPSIDFGSDGSVTVDEDFRRAEAAWYEGLAAIGLTGTGLIVDEVFLGGRSSQDRLAAALSGLSVRWVGVRCAPEVAAARERARPDRVVGMAHLQAERVHEGVRYDLVVDTTVASAAECANSIAAMLARRDDSVIG